MFKNKLGEDSPIPKFIHLKIQHRDGIKSLTTLEEGEFKVPIDGCMKLSHGGNGFLFGLQTYLRTVLNSPVWPTSNWEPPGGTHIFGRTGMCRSNGSLFYKKSLNMGPVFYQNILKHGSNFLTEPKCSGFRMAKTPKIAKFLKNGPIFQEKSLKMGTLFCQNHP